MNENGEDDFLDIKDEQSTKIDDQISHIQDAFAKEKSSRKEERFVWIVLTTILLDLILFSHAKGITWSVPIVIFIMQLIVLSSLANFLGLKRLSVLINRMYGNLGKSFVDKRD